MEKGKVRIWTLAQCCLSAVLLLPRFLQVLAYFGESLREQKISWDCLDRRLSRLEGKKESEATVTEFIVKKYLEQ